MAINIREIPLAEAQTREVKPGNGRTRSSDNPFVDALKTLTPEKGIEITLDTGDSMRTIKSQITRASKEANVRVVYGETNDGALVVSLAADNERAAGERGKQRTETIAAS